jgi:hypothetical protein
MTASGDNGIRLRHVFRIYARISKFTLKGLDTRKYAKKLQYRNLIL